jgi:hypothetical protein
VYDEFMVRPEGWPPQKHTHRRHLVDNRTLATIGGIGAGTGVAYYLAQRRNAQRREQAKWTPTSRFLAGVAGGALSYYGMRRRGMVGNALAAAGMGLLTRGATNRRSRQLFGLVPAFAGFRGH